MYMLAFKRLSIAEISALEEKLVKAWQVKAGMMSELLTGKIRLV